MAKIVLENLAHAYGDNPQQESDYALKRINYVWNDGEACALLGPSGCGKTTTLRSIAGLEQPQGGLISLMDAVLYDAEQRVNIPMYERDIGMVFQSYAIWPHMNVF